MQKPISESQSRRKKLRRHQLAAGGGPLIPLRPSVVSWPSHTVMRRLPNRDDWLFRRILSGRADASIRFKDLCKLLVRLGFVERIRGSHHIFVKSGIEELINLQREGTNAKAYQVRQVRAILKRYNLAGGA